MTADYYHGYFYDTLSFFNTTTPLVRNRPIENINFAEAETDNFGVGPVATYYRPNHPDEFSGLFQGKLYVATAGQYTFYLGSDDAAYFWLDDNPQPLAFNAGDKLGFRETSKTCPLAAGIHTIKIHYGEHGGSQGLMLRYQGPGLVKQLVPNGVLYSPALPVFTPVLTTFDVTLKSRQVALNWATTSEQNSELFVIERSTDGVTFVELLRQPGAGTSSEPHAYEAVDRKPKAGMNFYRVVQFRSDRPPVYSPIKAVDLQPIQFVIDVYPVPNNGTFFVRVQPADIEIVRLEMLDMSGRRMYKRDVPLYEGTSLRMQPDLSTGMYLIRLTTNEGTALKKVPLGG